MSRTDDHASGSFLQLAKRIGPCTFNFCFVLFCPVTYVHVTFFQPQMAMGFEHWCTIVISNIQMLRNTIDIFECSWQSAVLQAARVGNSTKTGMRPVLVLFQRDPLKIQDSEIVYVEKIQISGCMVQ